jgi:hypothetical protein
VPVSNILDTNHNVLTRQADHIESFTQPTVAHRQGLNRKPTITLDDSAACAPTTSHQSWEVEGEAPPGYSLVLVKKPQTSTQPLHLQPQSQHYVNQPQTSHSPNAENEISSLQHDELRALHGGAHTVDGLRDKCGHSQWQSERHRLTTQGLPHSSTGTTAHSRSDHDRVLVQRH